MNRINNVRETELMLNQNLIESLSSQENSLHDSAVQTER